MVDRFWAEVNIKGSDECWPWNGAENYRGTRPKRAAWVLSFGAVPDGKIVVSDCGECCNPSHLKLSSRPDHCASFIKFSKMTRETVIEARDKYRTGRYTQKKLCEEYGISTGPMSALLRGKSWASVA